MMIRSIVYLSLSLARDFYYYSNPGMTILDFHYSDSCWPNDQADCI